MARLDLKGAIKQGKRGKRGKDMRRTKGGPANKHTTTTDQFCIRQEEKQAKRTQENAEPPVQHHDNAKIKERQPSESKQSAKTAKQHSKNLEQKRSKTKSSICAQKYKTKSKENTNKTPN